MDEVITEKTEEKKSIRQFYFKELRDELLILEGDRKKLIKLSITLAGTVLLAVIIVGVSNLLNAIGIGIIAAAIICIYPLFKFGMDLNSALTDYKNNYKSKIVRKIVSFVDKGLSYNPERYIEQVLFQGSKIFQERIDRYSGDDLVTGTIDKTSISFSEIHAEYKTETRDSKGRKQTQWHTIFKGLFFMADFNKEFNSFTVVMPDHAERAFGKFGQTLQSLGTMFSTRELIKLEDAEFEKYFAVYSPNQVEARYILSPTMMEKLVEFRKSVNREIYISFNFSKVFIGVPIQEDLFEPAIMKTILDIAPIERYYKIIELMVGIVNELDLNTRIWSKE